MLSDEKRQQLRALAEQATPGPWTVGFWPLLEPTHYVGVINTENPLSSKLRAHVTGQVREQDARYLAAVSPDVVVALLDELERLEARLEALSETIAVERGMRERREFRLAREAWQAAVGPELQSDETAFRKWYAEAGDLTIEVPQRDATGGGRWRG